MLQDLTFVTSLRNTFFILLVICFGWLAIYLLSHSCIGDFCSFTFIRRHTNGTRDINVILAKSKMQNSFDTKVIKRILWYKRPPYLPPLNKGELRPLKACPDLPCRETSDKDLADQADAIIFDVHVNRDLERLPKKQPGQVWVLYAQESSYHTNVDLNSSKWKNMFNWTCTYRRDSDIWMPYGLIEKRSQLPHKDYEGIAKRKTRMASWVVSHCQTPSKREHYIKLLEKNGIKTDIFGACGTKKFPRTTEGQEKCRSITSEEYSFSFALENSLCKDYITEKFFHYYNSDVILVVRGGEGNYKHFPQGIFINTADFKTAGELASYMKELHSNKTKYIEFLKRKDAYKAVEERFTHQSPVEYSHYHYLSEPMCDMCRKLLEGESKPRDYQDIHSWFRKDVCYQPNDLR